jgi:hypothetical protein
VAFLRPCGRRFCLAWISSCAVVPIKERREASFREGSARSPSNAQHQAVVMPALMGDGCSGSTSVDSWKPHICLLSAVRQGESGF